MDIQKKEVGLVTQTQRSKLQPPGCDQVNDDQENITIIEVNRVLEVGRLLLSVLTDDELEELQQILSNSSDVSKMGNAGVT